MKYWWLIFLPFISLSQDLPIIKYSTKDGLGHAIVYSIYEDKKGFIWFATDNGLTRYDGETFKNFTEANGLRSSYIFGITENDSSLVFSTFGKGLQFSNGYTIDTTNVLASEIEYPINILKDNENLWITDRSNNLFKVNRDRVKKYTNDIDYPNKAISKVIKVGNSIFASSYGLYEYNQSRDKFEEVPLNWMNINKSLFCKNLIEIDENRILLVSTSIYIANVKTKEIRKIKEGQFNYASNNLLHLQDGSILLAENNGNLWKLNNKQDAFELILHGPIINAMYQDKQGGIWLATYGQGAWYIPNLIFKKYALSGLINPILEIKHNEFVSVLSIAKPALQIQYKNEKLIETKEKIPSEKRGSRFIYYKNSNETISANITHVFKNKNLQIDSIWINRTISCYFVDEKKQFWIGLRTGLIKVSPDFKSYHAVIFFDDKIIRSITSINENKLLIGTNKGLYTLENEHKIEEVISDITIVDLANDKLKPKLYIATNKGLLQLDDDNKVKTIYPDIRFNKILVDKRNNLWSATSEGLLYFNHSYFNLLNEFSGLENDLLDLEYDSIQDQLFVLSPTGVTTFSVEEFLKNQKPFPFNVLVSELIINNQQRPFSAEKITLSSDTESIIIKFSAGFGNQKNQITSWYRINGGNWIKAENSRELSFIQPPFGEFNVQLKLLDEINQIESATKEVKIEIEKPFYLQTWLVVTALIVSIGLLVWLVILIYKNVNSAKFKKLLNEQRKAELEQKVLRNMLNPHFLNNAINSIQLFVTKNDQRKTLGYLAKFARLMQVNLELLENSKISLDKELKNIELYLEFEKLRFEGRLQYEINYPSALSLSNWKVPSLVLQPFVENAIWHGILPKENGGTVRIDIKEKESRLHILVIDDGIGLTVAKSFQQKLPGKTSRGTSLIYDRFELLNQVKPGHSLVILDRKQLNEDWSGTQVEIIIPV